MSAEVFEVGKHYKQECRVGRVMVQHVHWTDSNGEKLFSMFSMSIRAVRDDFSGEGSATASIDQWNVTHGELRALAEKMLAAADSLEAHSQQLGKEGG